MPVYEYKCESCGEVFELIQKFADEPLKVHRKCGGPVHRLISAPALQFKGTGWYVTDYAKGNGGSTPAHKSESSGSKDAAPAAKSDSGSDSTPAKPAVSNTDKKS